MTRDMTRCGPAFALLVALLPSPAAAITLPLVYTGCPAALSDPTRIEIVEDAKGVRVTYARTGIDPGPFVTPDVNLARISRRLFFTLRTPRGLVEFQGRVMDDTLIGRLSNETGAVRAITLKVGHETLERCDSLPDSQK
jgi:hypothetical protein